MWQHRNRQCVYRIGGNGVMCSNDGNVGVCNDVAMYKLMAKYRSVCNVNEAAHFWWRNGGVSLLSG